MCLGPLELRLSIPREEALKALANPGARLVAELALSLGDIRIRRHYIARLHALAVEDGLGARHLSNLRDEVRQTDGLGFAKVIDLVSLVAIERAHDTVHDVVDVCVVSARRTVAKERDTLRSFMQDASHHLRTPVTALTTFNELLLSPHSADSDKYEELLQDSKGQLERLRWIIDKLLPKFVFVPVINGDIFLIGKKISNLIERNQLDAAAGSR